MYLVKVLDAKPERPARRSANEALGANVARQRKSEKQTHAHVTKAKRASNYTWEAPEKVTWCALLFFTATL